MNSKDKRDLEEYVSIIPKTDISLFDYIIMTRYILAAFIILIAALIMLEWYIIAALFALIYFFKIKTSFKQTKESEKTLNRLFEFKEKLF